MLTGSGLGVTIDPDRVAAHATRRESLLGA